MLSRVNRVAVAALKVRVLANAGAHASRPLIQLEHLELCAEFLALVHDLRLGNSLLLFESIVRLLVAKGVVGPAPGPLLTLLEEELALGLLPLIDAPAVNEAILN